MSITVEIPTALRELTSKKSCIEVNGQSVIEVIENIESQYPGLKERLICDNTIHQFINIYVNDQDIRFAGGVDTALNSGDNITILSAVAGG